MKNRILSFVLAVVMVLAMVPATMIASSAEENDIAVIVGSTTAIPGGTALVNIYVSEANVGDYDGLCQIQVFLDLPKGISVVKTTGDDDLNKWYTTGESVTNVANADMGYFAGTAGATTGGALLATKEGLEARGGAYIATITLKVDDTVAAGEYTVDVSSVSVFGYRIGTTKDVNLDKTALSGITGVPGKIVVSADENDFVADEYEGAGEDYVVSATNASGNVVTSLLNADGDSVLTGEFGYVTVPASVATVEGVDYTDGIAGLIAKNPYDTTAASAAASMGTAKAPVDLYFHKSADGVGLVEAGYADLSNANKKKVTMKNILAAGVSEVQDAGRVTVYGNITVADLDYEKLFVSATFTSGDVTKTIESEHTVVYTTLRDNNKVVASADADVASTAGQTAIDGTYLCGMTVTGIPAGEYDVAVTVYGLVPGVAGFTYNVCSETVVTTVTVA